MFLSVVFCFFQRFLFVLPLTWILGTLSLKHAFLDLAKAVNFDLLYSIRCVFDFTAVLTCVIIFGHVDENLTELACICTAVEMHVVYMNRKFVHIRGIFGTYTQVLKTVLHDLTCQRNVVVFGCNYSEAVHFLRYVVIFCIFLVIKAF